MWFEHRCPLSMDKVAGLDVTERERVAYSIDNQNDVKDGDYGNMVIVYDEVRALR